MKKSILPILLALIILSTLTLSGCTEEKRTFTEEEEKLIGTWKGTNVIAFFSDGTCHHDYDVPRKYGTWKIEEGKLVLNWIDRTLRNDYELEEGEGGYLLTITEEGTGITGTYRQQ